MSNIKTPPILSPYMLIQEFVRGNSWKIFFVCILLNKTSAKQVWRIVPSLFEKYKDSTDFLKADADEVKEIIRPLGFKNVRYDRLRKMSEDIENGWKFTAREKTPRGIGKYGMDSYILFVSNYLIDDVLDKELLHYVQWAKEIVSRDTGIHLYGS